MAEKPEKKEKKDKSAAASEVVPVVAAPVEKKDKKEKATAASEAPVVAAPVEKKNTPPRPKTPKLAKKNKSRLPRRQKKALQKAANK
jgi:hypothetical protein